MGSTVLFTETYLPYKNIIPFVFTSCRYYIINIPRRVRECQWEILLQDFYKWHVFVYAYVRIFNLRILNF